MRPLPLRPSGTLMKPNAAAPLATARPAPLWKEPPLSEPAPRSSATATSLAMFGEARRGEGVGVRLVREFGHGVREGLGP